MSTTGRLTPAVAVSALALILGSSAFGQAQSKDQQKCINTLNKDTCKVAVTQGKENSGCVKLGTKGTATSGCLTADAKGKVAKKEAKASADEGKHGCLGANAPNFGHAGVTAGNAASRNQEVNLFSDTYGTTDPTAVISIAKADAKCQSAVTKDLEKLIATKWKQYVKCKKTTLKAGATSAAALQACLSGDPNSIAADPKGKIAKKLAKLTSDIGKDCIAPVVIGMDFPGGCSGSSTSTLAACLDRRAECRICLALNATDGLTEDCDLFDDGIANGSCGGCPLAAGRYTFTQTAGGHLRVATFAPFPFPAGGTIVQDVSAATPPACVHTTVVPFPSAGYSVPIFCVPALGATTSVTQVGCGVGEIDSNGGSDFTIAENGDTSEIPVCGVHQATCPAAGPAPDSSGRLDITVGNASADTCASGGTANAIVTIPVDTLTWVAGDSSCPDTDGTFNPGTDTQLAHFPQTLDFTTDTTSAQFTDLGDLDGCKKSGLGPVGPFTETGVCIDTGANTLTTAASGAIFSSGGPTYDLLFSAMVPNSVSVGPSGGATCGSPPLINFAGLATRCIIAP